MKMIPRPEHPNPQWERKNWKNLNGQWQFEIDYSCSGEERGLPEAEHLSGTITVPFCPESELSGIGHKDFINGVWYKRTIDLTEKGMNFLGSLGEDPKFYQLPDMGSQISGCIPLPSLQ